MNASNFLSNYFINTKTSLLIALKLSKLFFCSVLFLLQPIHFYGQEDFHSNPCVELSGPIFPGGATLCETYSTFVPNYTIPNLTYASNLNLTLWPHNLTAFYGKKILVQGIFIIDIPTAFMYCQVKLAPGAIIVVASDDPTEILAFNSKFFSCEVMWKGIILGDDTRCRMFSCHLEDAQYAITVGNNVSLALYSNKFNRNFVSITNDSDNSTLPFVLFKNNIFDCTSALNDYYDLNFENPYEDMASYSGILLKNCVTSIGYYNSNNRFKNLNYGIFLSNATANIKGCTFSNAQIGSFLPELIPGVHFDLGSGIAANNSNVLINGSEGSYVCTFDDSDIQATNSNIDISYSKFHNSSIKVLENVVGETVKIEYNSFINDDGFNLPRAVILVERSAASGESIHTNINFDTIQINDPALGNSEGIYLKGLYQATDYTMINGNVIKSSGIEFAAIKLAVGNSENTDILYNFIQSNENDDDLTGISTFLGVTTGTHIKYNQIYNGEIWEEKTSSTGISTHAVQGETFCYNYITGHRWGMRFSDNCDNSSINVNALDDLGSGLLITNGNGQGLFGVQKGTPNYFLKDWTSESTYSVQNLSTAPISKSSYFLNSTDFALEVYNPDNKNPSSGWFKPFAEQYTGCPDVRSITGYDSLIINSDAIFTGLSDQVQFSLKKTLIFKIFNFGLEGDYSTFLGLVEDDSEYKIAAAEWNMKKAFQMDLTDQGNLDDILVDISKLYDSIYVYDNYNYLHIDSVTFAEGLYFDSLQSKLEQINDYYLDQQYIKSNRMTQLVSDLTDIYNDLDTITTRDYFDENYVKIYKLFIQKIIYDDLKPEDYDDLNEIAQADENSLSNVTAIAYFNLCSEVGYPDYGRMSDEEMESLARYDFHAQNRAQNNTELIQNEKLDLINEKENFDYLPNWICIFDLTGRRVKVFTNLQEMRDFISKRQDILPNGVYGFWMRDKNGVIHSGLFPSIK